MIENLSTTSELNHYIFTNKQIMQYDMVLTKQNVENLISEYKESKFWYFASEKKLKSISAYYGEKYNQSTVGATDKIGTNVSIKLDAIAFIRNFEDIINPLLETFSNGERKYYTYCLSNEYSEQVLADNLGLSRTGVQPIKNNCILKIGLAFQVAVKK